MAQSQWQPLSSAYLNTNKQRFDDVFFLNDNLGWALNGAGASVYKTTDGGVSWTLQLNEAMIGVMLGIPTPNYYFRNIEFLNENIGFVGTLTESKFFKTTDGGTSWSEVTTIGTATKAVCGLDCVGTSTVYGCGSYMNFPPFIIKSTDSGATWQYIDMSAYATGLVEIMFLDENIGFVSGRKGSGGIILKTTDGGATWNEIFNSGLAGEYVWKMQTLTGNPNVMFGSIQSVSPNLGKLIKSTDGGVTWVSKNAPETSIQAVGFVDENHGWMGGHNTGFYETFDAGTTWTNINLGSNLNRIFIIRDDFAYASGATIYKFAPSLGNNQFEEQSRVPLLAKVYPNPVKNKLSLEVDFKDADHLIIELYDALGRRMCELKQLDVDYALKKTFVFDFPYPSGTYFIDLHSNSGRQSVKVIK
ncbi:YCF48-related protein [Flavobacterium sp. H122]|uniref:YCF48-related protein n=1 Tax=Flavobacterium sp. H122 TaxID=2529860 RepID=UPI00145B693D|nr:YCF48-related protein [Flavobacterium sp. H122]